METETRIKEAEVMAKRIRDAVEEQCTNCEFKDGKYCSWSKKKRTGRPPCQEGKMLKQEQVKTSELEKMPTVHVHTWPNQSRSSRPIIALVSAL